MGDLKRLLGLRPGGFSFVVRDTSAADPSVPTSEPSNDACMRCSLCACDGTAVSFSTFKALQMHQRVKHGIRSPMRAFAAESGICPANGTNFRHRLRLLSHLSDSRRPACRDKCLAPGSTIAALAPDEVARLDALDTAARGAARRAGHTHVLAVGAARRADGSQVGRVTA